MNQLNHPHDAFFKQLLSKPEVARDFLTQHQTTGLEMLISLLRYVAKAGTGASRQEITSAVNRLLPKEGEILMKTAAQEWIEDALREGREEGWKEGQKEGQKEGLKEGIEKGRMENQRRTIVQILHHRFAPAPEIVHKLMSQLEQIDDEEILKQLLDESLLTILLHDFIYRLETQLVAFLTRQATSATSAQT